MSRELARLTRDNPDISPGIVLAMSHTPLMITKKEKRKIAGEINESKKPVQRWIWTPFHSSARTDNASFYHWERAMPDGTRPEYTGGE